MYQPNGQQRLGVVEQRYACTSCAIAFNGNVDDGIDRESHRLTVKHLQAKEKADEIALVEVLDKTFAEVLNLNDRHDENSNPIDLEVVQEDQSNNYFKIFLRYPKQHQHPCFSSFVGVNEASADSSKSFNEAQHTAESIPISADKTYEEQLIQSYLDKAPGKLN